MSFSKKDDLLYSLALSLFMYLTTQVLGYFMASDLWGRISSSELFPLVPALILLGFLLMIVEKKSGVAKSGFFLNLIKFTSLALYLCVVGYFFYACEWDRFYYNFAAVTFFLNGIWLALKLVFPVFSRWGVFQVALAFVSGVPYVLHGIGIDLHEILWRAFGYMDVRFSDAELIIYPAVSYVFLCLAHACCFLGVTDGVGVRSGVLNAVYNFFTAPVARVLKSFSL